MNCRQVITHIVREGDSFYTVANYYQIPLEALMEQNPEMDPNNLQVGAELTVCLDSKPSEDGAWGNMDWDMAMDLSNEMRRVWEQHVNWTRMLMLSITGRMQDQAAVTDRLTRNPGDIASIFRGYVPGETADRIESLLAEHLRIGSQLMTAMRDGNRPEAERLNWQWYANADQIAAALAAANPQYNAMDLKAMLYHHLELLTKQLVNRLAGNYPADIQAADEGEDHILKMADYLTSGLVQQFPRRFV